MHHNCLKETSSVRHLGCAQSLCCVQLFVTPQTVAHQAPLSMGILQVRILQWVAMPSSWGSSQLRDQTQVFHIKMDSIPSEPPGKPLLGILVISNYFTIISNAMSNFFFLEKTWPSCWILFSFLEFQNQIVSEIYYLAQTIIEYQLIVIYKLDGD